MSEPWKRGTGLGDHRLDERADLVLAQVVASHSLVLNRLGGEVRDEVDPPAGVEPLPWRLATTLPMATLAEACEIIRLYRLRWRIEETFRTLEKDGPRLEATQVRGAHAVMNLAALGLTAAIRIVQLVDARDGGPRPASDGASRSCSRPRTR